MVATWTAFLELIRWDRPVGWLLLLWPTWLALWLAADGVPPPRLILIFGLGVFLTRSAGCIINDYADRWLDPHVQRTRQRPLARGALSGRFALTAFALLMGLAFGLVLWTNWSTVLWSMLALAVAVVYPYAKRVFPAPQLVLGIAFSLGIPMAWSASGLTPGGVAGVLLLTNLLWTMAYDTQYAMVDREDDRRMGARSTALWFGRLDLAIIGLLQVLVLAGMIVLGQLAGLGGCYALGIAVVAGGFAWQAWITRSRAPEACFRAFRSQHWLGLAWFLGAAIDLSVELRAAGLTG